MANLLQSLGKLLGGGVNSVQKLSAPVRDAFEFPKPPPALHSPNRPLYPGAGVGYVGNEPAARLPLPIPMPNVPTNFLPFNREQDFNMPWRVDSPIPDFTKLRNNWTIPTQMTPVVNPRRVI